MASSKNMKATGGKTLTQFMLDKAKAVCPVCALPDDVKAQLGPPASDKGFTRRDQVEWLRTACAVPSITEQILAKHFSARHDRAED